MLSERLPRVAGRVPRRLRRAVPWRLRNRLVERFGHPAGAFDAERHPRRLNLGCGYDKRPGYLNVDGQAFHAPDLVADVRDLPQLPSGRYDEVIAQDLLEHLPRADGARALVEWRRLLAPGGRLWLRVPDVPTLLRWLAESDDVQRHRQVMHSLYGTQAYDGDFHLAGYTDLMLCAALQDLGLERITGELRDEWLWEVEGNAPSGERPASVAVLWGAGFYPREAGGGAVWRWSAGRSELLLYALAAGPAELALTLEDGHAEVSGAGVVRALEAGRNVIRLRLAAGANRLRLSSDHRVDARDDPRELAFCLSAATIAGRSCL